MSSTSQIWRRKLCIRILIYYLKGVKVPISNAQIGQISYFKIKWANLIIKVGYFLLFEKQRLSTRFKNKLKFWSISLNIFFYLRMENRNLIIDIGGEKMTINLALVTDYKFHFEADSSQISNYKKDSSGNYFWLLSFKK